MSVNESNASELEVLKQRIIELETENAEVPDLRRKISEFDAERAEFKRMIAETLQMTEEERTKHYAENVKLKSRVGKLEARLAIVEENSIAVGRQLQNDNSSDDSSSNFNSVAEYYKKPLVDVKTDDSSPGEDCFDKQELIAEVATMSTNFAKPLNGKSLEEKGMDSFLVEADKKIVSSDIKRRNRKRRMKKMGRD